MDTRDGSDDSGREHAFLEALDETVEDDPDQGSGSETFGRLSESLSKARASLEGRRNTSRVIDAGFFAVERNRRIPSTLLAGALASRIVIYAIPFLVLVVVATGFYSDAINVDPVQAARDAGMAGLLAEAVEETSGVQEGFRFATLVAMLFAAVWAGDSLAKLIRRIHALIWGVRVKRPRFRLMLPLAVIAVSMGALMVSRFGLESDDWPATVVISEVAFEFVAVTVVWIVVALFLPVDPEARTWPRQLPGALLVAIGVLGMKAVTVFYLAPRAVTLTERYGDVTSAIIFITWAYWMAFIIVFSAELNSALFRSRRPSRSKAPI